MPPVAVAGAAKRGWESGCRLYQRSSKPEREKGREGPEYRAGLTVPDRDLRQPRPLKPASHFDTLEEIHREVVRHALREIEATFPDESLEPLQRLLQLARNRVRLLRSNAGLAWVLRSEQAYLTMPRDAVRQLRAVVERSRRFLLDAIREGAARGEIRGDIEPESLLVLVMGAIHAMAGMSGVHRGWKGRKGPEVDRVLAALQRVLVPPATSQPRPTGT